MQKLLCKALWPVLNLEPDLTVIIVLTDSKSCELHLMQVMGSLAPGDIFIFSVPH